MFGRTDAELELSGEEVLGYSSSDSEEDYDDDEDSAPTKPAPVGIYSDDEEVQGEEDEEEGWGHSRKDYYNTDTIATEIDAQEEEDEARRLQQRKRQKMSEADFGFNETEWLDSTGKEDEDGAVVTEVLRDVEITSEMGPEERLRLLQMRHPEFEFLANELLSLHPVLQDLQAQMEDSPGKETVVKCRALAAYVGSLSIYFALLTSPSRSSSQSKTLDPAELRDHPVMDSLLQCRSLWTKVKGLKTSKKLVPIESSLPDQTMIDMESAAAHKTSLHTGTTKREKKSNKSSITSSAASRAARLQAAEASIADLSSFMPTRKRSRTVSKSAIAPLPSDDESDFGEEESLSSKAAAEKAAKKRSLRFYTSQITQKSNKRAGAGRDAGGDEDLPYRERFRDRAARLNAEAETRGKKLDSYGRGGVRLGEGGSDDDEGQGKVAQELRGEEDEYYDLVAQSGKSRNKDKQEKAEMIKQAKAAGGLLRVVEESGDGKRAIGYVIEKNKGLAPKRKKEVRNPRVKKKKKYEEKMRKLASSKPVYKGGEERGGYSGEKTGIKTGLVKSVKL